VFVLRAGRDRPDRALPHPAAARRGVRCRQNHAVERVAEVFPGFERPAATAMVVVTGSLGGTCSAMRWSVSMTVVRRGGFDTCRHAHGKVSLPGSLSYVFGVVIVAGSVSLVAGLVH